MAVLVEVIVYGLGVPMLGVIVRWAYLFWTDRKERR
jgi:hypothetical protein